MNKQPIWIILRIEDEAVKYSDSISIKGGYDSEAEALTELNRLTALQKPNTKYQLFLSRRFIVPGDTAKSNENLTQGFLYKNDFKKEVAQTFSDKLIQFKSLFLPKSIWEIQKNRILPTLSVFVEEIIAEKLGGNEIAKPGVPYDIQLKDGTRIEVKTILLDQSLKRSPTIRLSETSLFDKLAVVVFFPDLSLKAAKIFPNDLVQKFSREVKQMNKVFIEVKITDEFLNLPEANEIEF